MRAIWELGGRLDLRLYQVQIAARSRAQPRDQFGARTDAAMRIRTRLSKVVRVAAGQLSHAVGVRLRVTGFLILAVYPRSSIPQYCYGVPRSISSLLPATDSPALRQKPSAEFQSASGFGCPDFNSTMCPYPTDPLHSPFVYR